MTHPTDRDEDYQRRTDAIKAVLLRNWPTMCDDGYDLGAVAHDLLLAATPLPAAPADDAVCPSCGMPPNAGRHANYAVCYDPCHAAPAHDAVGDAIGLVAAERRHQIAKWPLAHDDEHGDGQLLVAAVELAAFHTHVVVDEGDPWGLVHKHGKDMVHSLVVAAALIVAEIERLQRANALLAAERAQRDAGAVAEGRVGDQRAQGAAKVTQGVCSRCGYLTAPPACTKCYSPYPTPARDGERDGERDENGNNEKKEV